jgi:hypothetical protein
LTWPQLGQAVASAAPQPMQKRAASGLAAPQAAQSTPAYRRVRPRSISAIDFASSACHSLARDGSCAGVLSWRSGRLSVLEPDL